MSSPAREQALARIRANVERFGRHIYAVSGGQSPRFVYTIGVSPAAGVELVLAGGAHFTATEAGRILNALGARDPGELIEGAAFDLGELGRFSLGPVASAWVDELLLGACDFYGEPALRALQVLPEAARRTVDVPDLSRPFAPDLEPVWRYLFEPWDHPVSDRVEAVTDLAALRGEPVTEAARWEEDQWELFAGAGPDVPPEDVRVVPLGVLLGADPSLAPVLALALGEALRREGRDDPWQRWGR